MSTAVLNDRLEVPSLNGTAILNFAARVWFAAAIIGQLLFAFTVASYYGLTAARGDFREWNRHLTHGYVAGDPAGNAVVIAHLLSAVLVILAGAIQFIPRIRVRHPRVHRWSGRLYVLAALALSGAGVFMMWVQGTVGDAAQHWGITLNAVAIWVCAAMAVRYAMARDFRTHRRWTIRLFLAVSGSWFFRAGLFLTFLIFRGPYGFDPKTFTGPMITFMVYATYLLPLGVAELYFRAQANPGALRRIATAAVLLVLAIGMTAGVFTVAAAVWVPRLKVAWTAAPPERSVR